MRNSRLFLLAVLSLIVGAAWAQGPNNTGTYYSSASGKSGAALRTAMGAVINPHTNIGYNGLWTAYRKTDKRADGYVRDWYSNITNYRFGTDQAGSYSKEGDCYNREHTVPQSWFNEASPMKADIVHVVPSDAKINGVRSNYPFGEVLNITTQSANGYSKLGSCKTVGYSGTVFEPNDDIKGDLARIYFYMATCYVSQCSSWSGGIFTGSDGLVKWTLDMMMQWSKQDPIDDVELARNEAVYEVQRNRNPFVDYPGLEEYIWGDKKDQTFSYDNYDGSIGNVVAMPTFTPDAGSYYQQVEVTIGCATEGAAIYYTTDGADASEQSIAYEGPFTLTETSTIKAVAVLDDVQSAQAVATYTITDVKPDQPTGGVLALNSTFFNCDYTGSMSNATEDLVGTQNGITVTYALGSGSNRYCNAEQIRLYQGNTLTFAVDGGSLTALEFTTPNQGKVLQADKGTVSGYNWAGDAKTVVFSVNDGSGNLQLTTVKVTVKDDATGIERTYRMDLAGRRVVYNLRGQRVENPTHGIYIVDGRKVVIP